MSGQLRKSPFRTTEAPKTGKHLKKRRFLVQTALLAICLLLPLELAAQTDSDSDGSLIFPSVARHVKRPASTGSDQDVRQPSPVSKTVFAQQPATSAQSNPSYQTVEVNNSQCEDGVECCPDCGRPLDHPIQGTCDDCGPCRRFLRGMNPMRFIDGFLEPKEVCEPWINRPFSAGILIGPIWGSQLIDNWVSQQTGTLSGIRLGWDFDDDWGLEMRLASGSIMLSDSDYAYQTYQSAIQAYQVSNSTSTTVFLTDKARYSDHFIFDVSMLYYPWGDSVWRPYLLFGIGTDRIDFSDISGKTYSHVLVSMPVGLGVKTRLSDWLVFRLELTDNIAFAGHSVVVPQQNASLTGAFEIRFGRSHTTYWPWNPGR